MISIDKNKVQKPSVLEYNNKKLLKLLNTLLKIESGKDIDNLYKDKEVKDRLEQLYSNKCAYCEGTIDKAQFTEHIDHYRPKNGVYDGINHNGYFWLTYEWTNLLPACASCNIAKSNHFPIQNARISYGLENIDLTSNTHNFEHFNIDYLNKIEKPLLLNPEVDEVEKHFLFLPNGLILPLTDKATKTINILKLNRSNLVISRKKIVDDVFSEFIDKFTVANDENELLVLIKDRLRELEKLHNRDRKYSRLGYFIFYLFGEFIIKRFERTGLEKHGTLLKNMFLSYIRNQ